MPFRDRVDAGRKLARALRKFRGHEGVVLALPRGGVPVAAEVAVSLHAPLDLILVRKIGVPMQPELAMGAMVDGPEPYVVRLQMRAKAALRNDRTNVLSRDAADQKRHDTPPVRHIGR